jgi:hypothetical protein
VPDALIDPIAATSTATHTTSGDTSVFHVRSFGAGNVNGGRNSPEVTVKVSVLSPTPDDDFASGEPEESQDAG